MDYSSRQPAPSGPDRPIPRSTGSGAAPLEKAQRPFLDIYTFISNFLTMTKVRRSQPEDKGLPRPRAKGTLPEPVDPAIRRYATLTKAVQHHDR
jgi:hypothetical protein